jgi:hypothetical protein
VAGCAAEETRDPDEEAIVGGVPVVRRGRQPDLSAGKFTVLLRPIVLRSHPAIVAAVEVARMLRAWDAGVVGPRPAAVE